MKKTYGGGACVFKRAVCSASLAESSQGEGLSLDWLVYLGLLADIPTVLSVV